MAAAALASALAGTAAMEQGSSDAKEALLQEPQVVAQLCAQLLAALQAATVLTSSESHFQQLSTAGVAAAAVLGPARTPVAADEALELELRRGLNVVAAEAAVLLPRCSPFEATCRQHPFVAAELAATGGGRSGSTVPAGLAPFLAAAQGLC